MKGLIKSVNIETYNPTKEYEKFDVIKINGSPDEPVFDYFVSVADENLGNLDVSNPQGNSYWKKFGDYKSWNVGDLWQPDFGTSADIEMSDSEAVTYNFGDGYKQIVSRGLIFSSVALTGVFKLEMKEVKSLIAFFEFCKGSIPFKFSDGTQITSPRFYVCDEFKTSFDGFEFFMVEASWREYKGNYEKFEEIIAGLGISFEPAAPPPPPPPPPERITTPVISPASGTVFGSGGVGTLSVSISSSDPDLGNIIFTMGGGTTWVNYTGPFDISASTLISAQALPSPSSSKLPSIIASAQYTLHQNPNLPHSTHAIGQTIKQDRTKVIASISVGHPTTGVTLSYKIFKLSEAEPSFSAWIGTPTSNFELDENTDYRLIIRASMTGWNSSEVSVTFKTISIPPQTAPNVGSTEPINEVISPPIIEIAQVL